MISNEHAADERSRPRTPMKRPVTRVFPVGRARQGVDVATWMALGAYALLGLWRMNDALGAKGIPFASYAYAVLFGGFGTLLLFAPRVGVTKDELRRFKTMAVCCVAVGLIPMIPLLWRMKIFFYPTLADITSFAFLGLSIAVCFRCPNLVFRASGLHVFAVGLTLAAGLAPIAARYQWLPDFFWHNRFDPPHFLLSIYLTVLGLNHPGRTRLLCIVGVLGCFVTAFLSGNRTVALLGLTVPVIATWWSMDWRSRIALFAVVAVLVCAVFTTESARITSLSTIAPDYFTESRFDKILGGPDESLEGRMNEVRDVVNLMIEHPISLLTGFGHGATWTPVLSHPEMNMEWEGDVHNIHVTYAALLFRWGLIGAVVPLIIFSLIGLEWLTQRTFVGSTEASMTHSYFLLGATASLLGAFTNNVFFDPLATFTIAAYLTRRVVFRQ